LPNFGAALINIYKVQTVKQSGPAFWPTRCNGPECTPYWLYVYSGA